MLKTPPAINKALPIVVSVVLTYIFTNITNVGVNWFSSEISWGRFVEITNISINVYLPVLLATCAAVVMLILFQSVGAAKLKTLLTEAERQKQSLLVLIEETREAQYVDTITGIPNNLLWREHLGKLISNTNSNNKFQAMLIDIVDFNTINKNFNPNMADKILWKIAQELRGGMRRNEQMYRRRKDYSIAYGDAASPNKDIYRRFRGGDEFFIYIKGTEADAVGFLSRLHKSLRTKISKDIGSNILKADFTVQFYAATCPIFRGDTTESVELRLDELLDRAKYDDRTRLAWYSQVNVDLLDESQLRSSLYDEAQKEFS